MIAEELQEQIARFTRGPCELTLDGSRPPGCLWFTGDPDELTREGSRLPGGLQT